MALIAYLMERKDNYGPHLIIVPNAVMVNWKSELTQWLPTVRCVYYVGHKVRRPLSGNTRALSGSPGSLGWGTASCEAMCVAPDMVPSPACAVSSVLVI